MKLLDLIGFCIQSLTRRKVRTLLTVTGVMIGTCCIVVMVALAEGIRESNRQMLSQMGDLTIIEVYNRYGSDVPMDDGTMQQIAAMDNVSLAAPLFYFRSLTPRMYAGKNQRYQAYMYNVVGVYPDMLPVLEYQLQEGAYFSQSSGRKLQMVFGQNAAYRFEDSRKRYPNNTIQPAPDETGAVPEPFFDPMSADMVMEFDPVKEDGKPLKYEIQVTGVLVGDYSKIYETMDGAFMRIEDMKKIMEEYRRENKSKKEPTGYDRAIVKVSDLKYVGETEEAIKELGFDTYSMESFRQSLEQSARLIQFILGGLGAISLFVAAIGIANTMIMSIYERTREIGVMKVLGCMVGDIRAMFLVEAGLIGFLGGIIGVGLSWLLVYLLNNFSGPLSEKFKLALPVGSTIAIIPPWLVAFGLIFAVLVGLVSGFYPANRAVRISALEAIKQE